MVTRDTGGVTRLTLIREIRTTGVILQDLDTKKEETMATDKTIDTGAKLLAPTGNKLLDLTMVIANKDIMGTTKMIGGVDPSTEEVTKEEVTGLATGVMVAEVSPAIGITTIIEKDLAW